GADRAGPASAPLPRSPAAGASTARRQAASDGAPRAGSKVPGQPFRACGSARRQGIPAACLSGVSAPARWGKGRGVDFLYTKTRQGPAWTLPRPCLVWLSFPLLVLRARIGAGPTGRG